MPQKLEEKDLDQFYKNFNLIPSIEGQLMYWIRGHLDPNLSNPVPNTYLEWNRMEVYVRKRTRDIQGETLMVLDIANIGIPKEMRGKLWFTNFLLIVQKINPWPITFIENVENKRLAKSLAKKSWVKIEGDNELCYTSFYKKDNSK